MKRFMLSAALAFSACVMSTAPVSAEEGAAEPAATETPAEERATQFVGVEGAPTDSVPGGTLLVAAYAVVWLLLFAFLWRLRRLHQRNEAELARLGRTVHGGSGPD